MAAAPTAPYTAPIASSAAYIEYSASLMCQRLRNSIQVAMQSAPAIAPYSVHLSADRRRIIGSAR